MPAVEITTENFEEVKKTEKPLLIDFWAAWCGPCRMFSPVVDEFAEENDGIIVGKVNVEEQKELATRFKVQSVPTLVVFKNGSETVRSTGVITKAKMSELVK